MKPQNPSQLYDYKFLTVREFRNIDFSFPVFVVKEGMLKGDCNGAEWTNWQYLWQMTYMKVISIMPDTSKSPHMTRELQISWE